MLGQLRTSKRWVSLMARSSTLTCSLEAERTRPPTPRALLDRPTPRLDSPWVPTMPDWTLPLPKAALLKAKPGVSPVAPAAVVPRL